MLVTVFVIVLQKQKFQKKSKQQQYPTREHVKQLTDFSFFMAHTFFHLIPLRLRLRLRLRRLLSNEEL